ncbi:uncharacterized protein [Epargyreus clarus]|uniref:uncharacterized protein n=1 Tax=Epargyreus clarus TaxID=520877 RepID=UPI003C2DE6E1
MSFTFLCLLIIQSILLFDVKALYNKNVECIIDKDNFPICKTVATNFPQESHLNLNMPSFEPYIPRTNAVFFNCTGIECKPHRLISLSQLSQPNLKYCFPETPDNYACEPLKYNNYKDIDKLLFLANNIPKKSFYLADCLVFSGGQHICHKKDNVNSHAKLVDIGTIARPNEDAILSQDELICEETDAKQVNCELNRYVPYLSGVALKDALKINGKILLKTGSYLISLRFTCKNSWCGYSGGVSPTRRVMLRRESYEPPGGSVYRCYYAKQQQICKKLYGSYRQLYNEREWLSS